MSEYLSYSYNQQGRFFPLVAIIKTSINNINSIANNDITYRDLTREDILNLYDQNLFPGGWLYMRGFAGSSGLSTWTRRFVLIKSNYLFLFHNIQSEKPIHIIPLNNVTISLPGNRVKSFDQDAYNTVKGSDGYEFEIYQNDYNITDRFYTLSYQEREDWYNSCILHQNNQINDDDLIEIQSVDVSIPGVITITKTLVNSIDENNQIDRTIEKQIDKRIESKIDKKIDKRIDSKIDSPIYENITTFSPFSMPFVPSPNKSYWINELDDKQTENVRDVDSDVEEEEDDDLPPVDQQTLDKLLLTKEARNREKIARQQASSRQSIDQARIEESKNPMNLSKIIRILLYFYMEELVEDPRPETSQQIPHLKGEWAENLLITIYQFYCSDNGFMTLEQFIEFMDDSGILQTHAPRDDNDEPDPSYEAQLDSVTLLTSVPKTLGYEEGKVDPLAINFFQFYQLLLKITSIVYPDLYANDETVAMNKILLESIVPLYAWCKGHTKRGSVDVLVLEDRIPLLLHTYAPNLWRVFLIYAQDPVGKLQDIALAFPEYAQANEKGMHGLIPGSPYKSKLKFESIFMPESACLRFAYDYALVPHLLSKDELKDLFNTTNRDKSLIATKLSVRDQAPTNAVLHRLSAIQNRMTRFRETSEASHLYSFMHPPSATISSPNKNADSYKVTASSKALQNMNEKGLSFSEFVELIAHIALDSMEQDNYYILFPTPFSKVLALLTIWGIADLKKAEEIRILHTTKVT